MSPYRERRSWLPPGAGLGIVLLLLICALVASAAEVSSALLVLKFARRDLGSGLVEIPSLSDLFVFRTPAALLAVLIVLRTIAAQACKKYTASLSRSTVRAAQRELISALATASWVRANTADRASIQNHLTVLAEEQRGIRSRLLEGAIRAGLYLAYVLGFALVGYRLLAMLLLLAAAVGVGAAVLIRKPGIASLGRTYGDAYRRFAANAEGAAALQRVALLAGAPHRIESRLLDSLLDLNRQEDAMKRAMQSNRLLRVGVFAAVAVALAFLCWHAGLPLAFFAAMLGARALMALAKAVGAWAASLPRALELDRQLQDQVKLLRPQHSEKAREGHTPQRQIRIQSLELAGVCFGYPGAAQEVLSDVHLHLERGDILIIEGVSGAGKSTLGDLIVGLLEPTRGKIHINGRSEADSAALLRAHAMLVPPVPAFLGGGIEDNLRILAPTATPEELVGALKVAAADFALAIGPDTMALNELELRQLSHGQRQRIAIARALLVRPQLLILDEALSGLDYAVQQKVLAGLIGQSLDRITVIISYEAAAWADALGLPRVKVFAGRVLSTRDTRRAYPAMSSDA